MLTISKFGGPGVCGLPVLLLVIALVVTTVPVAQAEETNQTCKEGLLVPRWLPDNNLSIGDRIARGLVYFLVLCYLFVGVSIVADRFMAAIEVITSQEKEITIKRPNGETQTVVVRIWNETVANLTLMALGSSAPEILLSIIEISGQGFKAGELGPGTIVGSAAFNLFIIIALCVYVVPSNENRRIKHLRVFFITATWSVFAYVWLYIILKVISVGVIDVWEALLTLFFFPATVLTAYIADRRLLIYKYLSKKYRMNKRGVIVEGEGGRDLEMGAAKANHVPDVNFKFFEADGDEEFKEFEEHRHEYITILRELRHKNPTLNMETLETMAREEIMNRGPKSRAFYRIQATRKLTGGGNVMKKRHDRRESEQEGLGKVEAKEDDQFTRIFFNPGHYTVMENVGEFVVTVTREGGDLSSTIFVDYRTEDGTANAGTDYDYAEGTLIFYAGDVQKQFTLSVIDDDVFEEDEHFYVRLSNMRIAGPDGTQRPIVGSPAPVQLVSPCLATVMILDDDHCGIFSFFEREQEVPETVGEFILKVQRFSGARGRVAISYRTVDGTAKGGKHFEAVEGDLIFENNETEKEIPIRVIDEDSYEKDVIFFAELGEPKQINDGDSGTGVNDTDSGTGVDLSEQDRIAMLGKPRLGDLTRSQIRIKENKEFKNTVDKLIKKANVSLMVGTSSWKEQFMEAITVSAGDDDGDNDDEYEKLPSCGDYVMHFVTIFWKVLFAFVPPTEYWGGWACFLVSMMGIGFLTAIIGDVACGFGCSVGLRDAVTAIVFVALGTSIPDTFASKVAAINDKYADSSIGNVTGSNAVNVFLGLGIAWSMAAIYHNYWLGQQFEVDPGNLAFSVTLFCSTALAAIMVLMMRRHPLVGGELGGPMKYKLPTTILFVCFWFFYIIMSSLESYDHIQGF